MQIEQGCNNRKYWTLHATETHGIDIDSMLALSATVGYS